jgi:hypothetical protein
MSGYFDQGTLDTIKRMGCTVFEKPVTFEELEAWLEDCEKSMDLSRPLGLKRKENRKECCSDISYQIEQEDEVLQAVLVNRSDSGLCIRAQRPPKVQQIVNVRSEAPVASGRLRVRWTKPAGDGAYLVGMTCC